jgi:hypothetical protein
VCRLYGLGEVSGAGAGTVAPVALSTQSADAASQSPRGENQKPIPESASAAATSENDKALLQALAQLVSSNPSAVWSVMGHTAPQSSSSAGALVSAVPPVPTWDAKYSTDEIHLFDTTVVEPNVLVTASPAERVNDGFIVAVGNWYLVNRTRAPTFSGPLQVVCIQKHITR